MPDVLACQDSTIPGQEASGMVSDPRPPSGDPLAAEIAAHRPYTAVTFSGGQGSHQLRCRKCGDEWPCLVRRLADERDALAAIVGAECPIGDLSIVDSLRVASAHAGQYAEEVQAERDALLAAGQALAEYMESRWRDEHEVRCYSAYDREWTCRDGYECQYKRPTPLDAWRALAPADGVGTD
jgi:hypothetical protein